ncbi:polysaccharide deacetylase family protein [Phlyctema vagabunda]|uniref:Polysaccharide deacetylase family protein n=1 Tax=Phlyctema vagabunda TaxID=108571 RepID=A0ABR4PEI5_9HELO
MPKKRVLVGYGIDLDAVANHINTVTGAAPNLCNISRGIFGATRGVERLLQLWERKNIKTSWYIPGHTLESFPNEMAKIRDAGHEIGLHGYTHEYPSDLTRDQFEVILVKTIQILTDFCGGRKPEGFTSPAWRNSPHQIEVLAKHGVLYDHSFMHDDFQPYFVSYGQEQVSPTNYAQHPSTWMTPMRASPQSTIVEIPASWTLDDWPPFQWDSARPNAHGYVDPDVVEKIWRTSFEWCYREYDTFIFPISIHPQVSGRPHVLMMHERLIDWINTFEGVEWMTFGQMANEFREGKINQNVRSFPGEYC